MRSRVLVYGPFRIPKGTFLLGLVIASMTVLFFAMGASHDTLTCDARGACELVQHKGVVADRRALERDAIVHVRVEHEVTTNKGHRTDWGVPFIELRDGTSLRILRVSPEDAARFAREVERGRVSRRAFTATVHGPRLMLVLALALACFAGYLLFGALRDLGAYVVEREGNVLFVTRRVFGVPVGTRTISLEGVTEVRVDRAYVKGALAQRYEPAEVHARVVLHGGERGRALTEGRMPGERVHVLAALSLHHALGLSCDTTSLEAEARRLSVPVPHSMGTALGGKIFAAWLGLCIGALLGEGVFWGLAIAVGLTDGSGASWPVGGAVLGALIGVRVALHLIRPQPPP